LKELPGGAGFGDPPVLTQLGKTVRQGGVSGKKDAPTISLQDISVVTAMHVALLPRTPVFHGESEDIDVAGGSFERLPFAPTKLCDVAETGPS